MLYYYARLLLSRDKKLAITCQNLTITVYKALSACKTSSPEKNFSKSTRHQSYSALTLSGISSGESLNCLKKLKLKVASNLNS
jgi:hypothetical protein